MPATNISKANGAAGFEVSSFSSAIISLEFADSTLLSIHRSILLRSAKLGLLLDSSTTNIDLKGFSGYAGHALVSYLYSGEYRRSSLKWIGPWNPTANVGLVELTSRFEIYALARAVELDGLEKQVRDEIEDIADRVDVFAVLDAVKEMYPTLIGNDTWFAPWIKSLVKKAFKNPGRLSELSPSTDFGVDSSVVKLLLGCMIEAFAETATVLPGLDIAEPDTSITDGSFEDAERDERPRPTQELPAMFRRDPQSIEPIPGPQALDKERALLYAYVASRKRPLWWQVLLDNSPPSSTNKELVASKPAPSPVSEPALDEHAYLPVPEPAVEERTPAPEPAPEEPVPEEDIDFLHPSPPKKSHKKKKKKAVVSYSVDERPEHEPEPEPEPKPEPEPEPALDLAEVPAMGTEVVDDILNFATFRPERMKATSSGFGW